MVNVGAAQLNFGAFISAVINFIIIAFIIFCLVKSMNKLAEEAKKLAGKQGEGRGGRSPHLSTLP